MGIAVFANSHQKPSCARLHKLPPLCSSGLLRSLCWCLYKSFCLFRDQRFGIAFVSHNQGLFGQGPTFRDRFCVPASGFVWAGTNVSGPLLCPSIRVCLGRDQRFGTACVSQHQGLFGQGPTFRDRFCVPASGSVWAGTNASGPLVCPIIRVSSHDPDNGAHKRSRKVGPWPKNDAGQKLKNFYTTRNLRQKPSVAYIESCLLTLRDSFSVLFSVVRLSRNVGRLLLI